MVLGCIRKEGRQSVVKSNKKWKEEIDMYASVHTVKIDSTVSL